MTAPVMCVHGWAGSFERTWRAPGFTALLEDVGRSVIGVDLLGHGDAPKPHEPEAYADLTGRLLEVMPTEPVDVVAFSLGALTVLELACRSPERFGRVVLGGVGANVFRRVLSSSVIDAVDGTGAAEDVGAQVFAQHAHAAGNDPIALGACLRASRAEITPERLSVIANPVLVVIGDQDFAGPGDPLVEALPNATLKVLRKTDHFATPESFGFIDAALGFLDAT